MAPPLSFSENAGSYSQSKPPATAKPAKRGDASYKPVASARTGAFGIHWHKVEGEIELLNQTVDKKVLQFLEHSKKTGEPLPPEVEFVVNTGKPAMVYKKRWTWIPACTALGCIATLAHNLTVDPRGVLIAFVISFTWYDFFSGVLHVILDNPLCMYIPIFDEPCLEFQWHHHIPHDLISKCYLEVCGDLNVVSCMLLAMYMAPPLSIGGYQMGMGYRDPMALNLVACKLLMSFFGQLCHSMSHMPPTRRPQWITTAQDWGLMLHPREHAYHHKAYDDKFCVGNGMWNNVITFLLNTSNKMHKALGGSEKTNFYCWLLFFSVTLFCDIPIFLWALEKTSLPYGTTGVAYTAATVLV